MEQRKGTIDKIFYQNPSNAWASVLVKKDEDERRPSPFPGIFNTERTTFIATGVMPGIRIGMMVLLEGQIETTQKYGNTFRVSKFSEYRPLDENGMQRFLTTKYIKDIGEVYAKKIIKAFGEDTYRIIENEPERLAEIKGLGKKRIKSLVDSFQESKDRREIMTWLLEYNITETAADKIYKTYGHLAIQKLKENPYRLSDEIKGIGFHKADAVALSIGIKPDSPFRIMAGLVACLEDWAVEGNTYMPIDELTKKAASPDYLSISEEAVAKMLERTNTSADKDRKIIIEENAAFLSYLYHAERTIAIRLNSILRSDPDRRTEPDLTHLGELTGISYSEAQLQAIRTALTERVSVITGGPGTGKTVTTNAIIRLLEEDDRTVLLCAPTGLAAKRITEVSGREAKTIHRLLEFTQGEFTRNRETPLAGDAIIIDEASMIDVMLMKHLLDAVPDKMRVVIVGDVDQLPSVGPGCVLRDIIDSMKIPVTVLDQIFRQAQGSDIIMNAHAVNEGRTPVTDNHEGTDFWFFNKEDRNELSDLVIDIVTKRVPAKFGYTPKDIQVLSPMKREGDPLATSVLNVKLQQALNPAGETVATRNGTQFRIGDRIMQTKNDYEKNVFNGDVGTIVSKLRETENDRSIMAVDFDGQIVRMTREDLANIDLSYAATVHKSQGSEYPVVVMLVHNSHYIMLKRNLVYTGITRAKKLCIIAGTRTALAMAVANEDTKKRFTVLTERISEC